MSPVTIDQMVAIAPECSHVIDKFIDSMNEAFERFEINTPVRQAVFIAQCGHESTRFTRIEENLNYSSNGLLRVFPNHFTAEEAKMFAYKPMMIANRVYASMGGNGDEASGDGWRFRGRGWIQVTLKRNYELRGRRLVNNPQFFLSGPDLMLEPEWAVRSAADYWDENNLNSLADLNTPEAFEKLTRKINRAARGLDDRTFLWNKARPALGAPEPGSAGS